MSDQRLRKALIRLAHAKPALQKDLLPLLKEGAGLPRATRRPAGEKFRSKVLGWAWTQIRQKLPAGGVLKDGIRSAEQVVERALGKSQWGDPKFATQIEVMDWIQGKTWLNGDDIGMGGSWSSYGGPKFSFPDVIDAYIARYGASATSGLTARVEALAKGLSSAQLAIAATIYAPASYGDSYVVKKDIESGLDKDRAEMWIAILNWVIKHSDYPPTEFNQR